MAGNSNDTVIEQHVAMYWDFENIHASLFEALNGIGAYRKARYTPQPRLVDVEALMDFAASFGTVAINRAYCNWQWFSRYQDVLLHSAVELIQLFPPGASAKNGADIKLCLDATEDLIRFPHISTIVIVGGDSDFLPVSQKVKAAGRTLVGVGSRASTNRHWAHSCHEFQYYESLPSQQAPMPEPRTVDMTVESSEDRPVVQIEPTDAATTADSSRPLVAERSETTPQDLVALVRKAIQLLAAKNGDPWVLKAAVRPMVKRLDPTFDEKASGFTTLSDLFRRHPEAFETRKGSHDQEISY